VELDVRDDVQWRAVIELVEKRFGGLHALVHNAGITGARWGSPLRIENTPDEAWDTIMGVNLRGAFLGTRAAIPLMCETARRTRVAQPTATGAIVNISSAQAIRPSGGQGPYAASKWGLRGFTKVAAMELAPMIRVNSVPGPIDTPMIQPASGQRDAARRPAREIPMQRVGTPDEVAVWCCSWHPTTAPTAQEQSSSSRSGRTAGVRLSD
jgi:3alpha(or 20beta)-hydroxysteroid dehydrogenase